jgi:membrane associated rhomboid family serine protease
MFVNLPSRKKPPLRWATPSLLLVLILVFIFLKIWPDSEQLRYFFSQWGVLSSTWQQWHQGGFDRRYFTIITALFIHINLIHLTGNGIFLLIFAYSTEKALGPWRLLFLFLLGGAIANLVASLMMPSPSHLIVGASGGVSALIGTYLVLFPRANLGIVLPLGVWLEFVKLPAAFLIGLWALLQWLFTSIGPAFGNVAWWAHVGGFAFGIVFGLAVRLFSKSKPAHY